MNLQGDSSDPNVPAVSAVQSASGGSALTATSMSGVGVLVRSAALALLAQTNGGTCVAANSLQGSDPCVSAIHGDVGDAVFGASEKGTGVHGQSNSGPAVRGDSVAHNGVLGVSKSNFAAAVSAINDSGGLGVFVRGTPAGHFEGNIEVTGDFLCSGDIRLQSGKDVILADCAEEFDACQDVLIEPGTVMVLDRDGMVEPSRQAYDKRVAGVVSGAGNCKPAIVLDKQQSHGRRVPLALLGKVYCKVDAQYASIDIGDLLTTSPTSGHAMKASDAVKGFGAVIGKALRSLESGQGMIPILVALQ